MVHLQKARCECTLQQRKKKVCYLVRTKKVDANFFCIFCVNVIFILNKSLIDDTTVFRTHLVNYHFKPLLLKSRISSVYF